MLCFPPKKTYSRFCCCLPLAFGTLILGCWFLFYGTWQIMLAVRSDDWFSWNEFLPFILGILAVIGGVGALLASCFCLAAGVGLLCKAYTMLCMSLVISFVVQWVVWIVYWRDNEKHANFPDDGQKAEMVVYTVISVLFFIIMWWMESIVTSHQQVLRAGGNGWEYKDYMEIRERRALA